MGDFSAVTVGAPLPTVATTLPLPMLLVRTRLLLDHLKSADSVPFMAHPTYGPQFASFDLFTNEGLRIDYLFRCHHRDNSRQV